MQIDKMNFDIGNTQFITDSNYESLKNKPKINGVELNGNKSLGELGISITEFKIVEALPETGDSNTIYLLPRENEENANVYDEYIYTEDKFEKIGSTDIDLTNYVTNEKLEETIVQNKGAYFYSWNGADTEETRAMFDEIIHYVKNGAIVYMYLDQDSYPYSYRRYSGAITKDCLTTSGGLTFKLHCKDRPTSSGEYGGSFLGHNEASIAVSVDSETGLVESFSMSRLYYKSLYSGKFLDVSNTTTFIPTGDYNPATKKYVDDQVGNISTILETLTTVEEVSE